jgi:hypothetical protein
MFRRIALLPMSFAFWVILAMVAFSSWPTNAYGQAGTYLVFDNLQGAADEANVTLTWQAQAHGRTLHKAVFTLERSTDGGRWEKAASQVFSICPKQMSTFTFVDPVKTQFKFYRLSVRDRGAKRRILATTRIVHPKVDLHLQVDLNRKQKAVNLQYILDRDSDLLLRIYDHLGKQILAQIIPSGEAGAYDHTVNFPFKKGIYLLVFSIAEKDTRLAEERIVW